MYFYGVPSFDRQINYEIDKLNLPVDSVTVDYENQYLELHNLNLKPILWSGLSADKKYPDSDAVIKKVKISGIDWWKLYKREILVADSIHASGIQIDLPYDFLSQISVDNGLPIKKIHISSVQLEVDTIAIDGEHKVFGMFEGLIENAVTRYGALKLDLRKLDQFEIKEIPSFTVSKFEVAAEKYCRSMRGTKLAYDDNRLAIKAFAVDVKDGDLELVIEDTDLEINGINIEEKTLEIQALQVADARKVLLYYNTANQAALANPYYNRLKIRKLDFSGKDNLWRSTHTESSDFIKAKDLALSSSALDIDLVDVQINELLEKSSVRLRGADVRLDKVGGQFSADKVTVSREEAKIEQGVLQIEGAEEIPYTRIHVKAQDLFNMTKTDTWKVDFAEIQLLQYSIDDQTLGQFAGLKANRIEIGECRVVGDRLQVNLKQLYPVKSAKFDFNFTNLVFDQSGKTIREKLRWDDYMVLLALVESTLGDKVHKAFADIIRWNGGLLEINSFEVSPASKRLAAGLQNSYTIKVPKISIANKRIEEMLAKESIYLPTVRISGMTFDITTDENIPGSTGYKMLLNEKIASMDLPLDIKQVEIRDAALNFYYTPKGESERSSLQLDQLKISIGNICNVKSRLIDDQEMHVKVDGRFMQSSDLKLHMNLNMVDKTYPYDYTVSLSKMPFAEVNELLSDLTGLKTTDGTMDKLYCNMAASKIKTKGAMDFYYRDLKIRFDKDRFIDKWNPVDFMLTRMMIDKNNREEWAHETGYVEKLRDPNKSMLYQIWEAIFEAMKYVMLPVI